MDVKVLFFARSRELCGVSEATVSLHPGSTTKTLLQRLYREYPQLEELHGNFVFSLNQEYLDPDDEQQLKIGDEVAVIPPISGGSSPFLQATQGRSWARVSTMLRATAARAARRGGALAAQHRCFAEAAVAPQTTVWDELSDLVTSDEGKRELATLRSTYADISQRLNKMAQDRPPIDWQAASKDIDPKLVQQFKQAFETMKLPKYEGNEIQEATAQFAALRKEAEALVAASQSRITEIKAEIAAIQKEKERIATTTIDDELAADPELAKEVDAEVEKNYFMVT